MANTVRREIMHKYIAIHKQTNEEIIISDRDLDNYDLRTWFVEDHAKYLKKINSPLSIIPIFNKKGERQLIPIFRTFDLDNFYISKTGHFIIKTELSQAQKVWIQANIEGEALINGNEL